MPLTILATSDLHLGMKFAGLPDVQAELAEARFACLERLVATANARRVDLLLVAGDLFHQAPVKRDVLRAAQSLRAFEGRLAAVLPGNHDHLSAGPDSLWPVFREACGDRVLVLDEPRAYPLAHYDLDACLYPGPCRLKHSAANAIGWVKAAGRHAGSRHHVGVAHGSLAGVSPDFDGSYYPMREDELLAAGPDLWVIGHTHLRHPEHLGRACRIFIPGTPEPDGYDCDHPGGAWLLGFDDGAVAAEPIETGAYRFVHDAPASLSAAELEALAARHAGPDAEREVLKVRLSGRIARAERGRLGETAEALRARVLHLDWEDDGVRESLDRAAVDAAWPADSFPHRLLSSLLDDPEALEIANEALEEARL
ncbi:MAG: metallophosphoesterase [Spirochaetes bacterium]|nr:metallophosphoesterase [Spirochaetota bacterium]